MTSAVGTPGWRAVRSGELVTPGVTALVLLAAFLLVLLATEAGRRPGGSQLRRQAQLYGLYSGEVLVGWASVSKPQLIKSVRGPVDLVGSTTDFRVRSPAGRRRSYETETQYEAGTAHSLYMRGSMRDNTSHAWECLVTKDGVVWRERGDMWEVKQECLFVPSTPYPFLLHKYSLGSWERLLRRLRRSDKGIEQTEVEVFDAEARVLRKIVCAHLDYAFAEIAGRKQFYWLVQFGPGVIGYVDPKTMRLDQLELTEERITMKREDAGLFDQLPLETTSY